MTRNRAGAPKPLSIPRLDSKYATQNSVKPIVRVDLRQWACVSVPSTVQPAHLLVGSGLDLCSAGLALASSCSYIGISFMEAFVAGFERLCVRPCNFG